MLVLTLLFEICVCMRALGSQPPKLGQKKKKELCIGPPEINYQKPLLHLRCNDEINLYMVKLADQHKGTLMTRSV